MRSNWFFGDAEGYPRVRVDPEWAKEHVSISPSNDQLMRLCLAYIRSCFGEDTELARKVTPDYAPGGKRMVRDPYDFAPGGYYYALAQPHVDVETDQLARIVPEGIALADGRVIELDVLIYATGLTVDYLSTIEIVGKDGRTLADTWGDSPRTYLGGTVPGFPNLFVNSGPNTGVGHANGHNFMAEVLNHFIFECLQVLANRSASSIEVTEEALEEFDERLVSTMEGSIWRHQFGAHTYYRNAAGRACLPTPFRHVDYWTMSRGPDERAFRIR
jgi:cation diffusion facilitator CzcD-associated flavoprotein CzcO